MRHLSRAKPKGLALSISPAENQRRRLPGFFRVSGYARPTAQRGDSPAPGGPEGRPGFGRTASAPGVRGVTATRAGPDGPAAPRTDPAADGPRSRGLSAVAWQ